METLQVLVMAGNVGWFTSTETVDLLGTGAQDGHLDFHTAPELCSKCAISLPYNTPVYVTTSS